MNIRELREVLKDLPEDMPVLGLTDNISRAVISCEVKTNVEGPYQGVTHASALVIDVS